MHTLTLEIPEQVYEPLAKAAEQSGRTPEEMALECLANVAARIQNDPIERFIGAFDSGVTDLGTRHDDYIGQSLLRDEQGDLSPIQKKGPAAVVDRIKEESKQ
jgi:hypothetical protein